MAPWRYLGAYPIGIQVSRVLGDLRKLLGDVPDVLDNEKAVRTFADACGIPLTDADIEADLTFPNRRFASRQWLRDQYPDFLLWCMEHGWLDQPEDVHTEDEETVGV